MGKSAILPVLLSFALAAAGCARTPPALAIQGDDEIHEGSYVMIGGIKQWIQIGGEKRSNPALLFLHDGPGASTLALSSSWRAWERYFTVVQWDQRGAGLTFRENGLAETGTLTVERMTEDGIEVTRYLRTHLHRDKIVLIGHSWGSILAIRMILEHPELYSAYVGTGQFVNGQENEALNYIHALALARSSNNTAALKALAQIGPPPYDRRRIGIERYWADILNSGSGDAARPRMDMSTPGLVPADFDYFRESAEFSRRQLGATLATIDLPSLGLDFHLPIFFFQGTADQMTPIELAEAYYRRIRAPHKEFVRFVGDHHFVAMNRPNEFLQQLVAKVRPWAVAGR